MADGGYYPTMRGDEVGNASGHTSACIIRFVTCHGPSRASFIAELYGLPRDSVGNRCAVLHDRGILARWIFDGQYMYGLPKDAPGAKENTDG